MSIKLKLKAAAEFELRRRRKTFRQYLEMVTPEYTWDVMHLEYSQKYLQRIANGESLKVMFLKPARHGKTEQNTVRFGGYYLYKNPMNKVILCAYNQEYANDMSTMTRQIYRETMPYQNLKNTEKRWQTGRGGEYRAAGILTGIAGKGANLLLFDDPVKGAETAYSKKQRDKIWQQYKMDFRTRLLPGGSIILTMTPWHHDGLVNRILNSAEGKEWIVVKMPALAGKNDILGRKEGEALWPAQWPRDELLKIKAAIGDDEFNALYQVSPVVLMGNIINRSWFRIESTENWPIRYDFIGQYWDTAFKKGQNNDYSVCVTLAKHKGKFYVLNVFRAKLTFPELKDEFITQALYYEPHFIGVEDKASGQSLVQEFESDTSLPVRPEPIKVSGDKELKTRAITAMLRNNGVSLPAGAYWIEDFLDELCLFPQAPHDDQVDAFAMGMTHQRESGYSFAAMAKS